MKNKRTHSRRGILLGAASMIAVSSLLFCGFSESVLATESAKVEKIPTDYSMAVLPETALPLDSDPAPEVPEGYEKANYTVKKGEWEFDTPPAAKDITMEQAAEAGAQELWRIFGVKLDNATITMKYHPAVEVFPRAYWYGCVEFPGERASLNNPGISSYDFCIDAVTGNVFNVQVLRYIDGPELSGFAGYDKELAKDPSEYIKIGKELGEKFNLVQGEIAAAEYGSQGFRCNDPEITIHLTGENGRRANVSISRHDQSLMSISYEEFIAFAEIGSETIKEKIDIEINEQEGIIYNTGDKSASLSKWNIISK